MEDNRSYDYNNHIDRFTDRQADRLAQLYEIAMQIDEWAHINTAERVDSARRLSTCKITHSTDNEETKRHFTMTLRINKLPCA